MGIEPPKKAEATTIESGVDLPEGYGAAWSQRPFEGHGPVRPLLAGSSGCSSRFGRKPRTSDEIHLSVKDSDAGFDRAAAKESRGLGLISMEERLKLVQGTLSIGSQPQRGTTIHARVPLNSGSDCMRAAG